MTGCWVLNLEHNKVCSKPDPLKVYLSCDRSAIRAVTKMLSEKVREVDVIIAHHSTAAKVLSHSPAGLSLATVSCSREMVAIDDMNGKENKVRVGILEFC